MATVSDITATIHADTEPATEALTELESKIRDVEAAMNDLNDTVAQFDGVEVEFEFKTEDN